ncbi:MAG: hypothetical protein OEZ48_10750 [Candidatus Bathyarchaeota archaeon]|nr:hypothetical protein [Candidatus Bathyarchaeota archaeon]MDH5688323.1 hypothetical protein [Candidatus Bathyarchaeota archaeon]
MKGLDADRGVTPNRIIFAVDVDKKKPYIQPAGATLRSDKDIEVFFSIIQNGLELQLGCLLLRRDRRHDSTWLRDHVQVIRPEYLPNNPHCNAPEK